METESPIVNDEKVDPVEDNGEASWLDQAREQRFTDLASNKETSANELSRSSGRGNLNPDVGLAFSGGGVRSATFNLGVLQALASQGVLDKVGYVSSVSGGSYINSWLAAWISKDGFQTVNQALADHEYKTEETRNVDRKDSSNNRQSLSDQEKRYRAQRPIAHLRHYSSYLTPQKGILSSDVWAAVAAYLLRLAPNFIFVLLAAFALIGLPYIFRNAYTVSGARDGWFLLLDSWRGLVMRPLASSFCTVVSICPPTTLISQPHPARRRLIMPPSLSSPCFCSAPSSQSLGITFFSAISPVVESTREVGPIFRQGVSLPDSCYWH